MNLKIRNLAPIRSAKEWTPDLGAKVYEAFQDLIQVHMNHLSQTNSNPSGVPQAPPPLNSIQVTARDGWAHVAISDTGPIYRGVQYYVEHADNANFTNPQWTQASGTEIRNHTEFIGNQTRYFRAYHSYQASGISAPVVHGGAIPTAVVGGGSSAGPLYLPSEGSGTGARGEGLSGPGPVPFRGPTPPVR